MEGTITFNTGYTLEFRPISRVKIAKITLSVQKEFEDRNEPLEPPTYFTVQPTPEHPDGITEPHNETTLETEEDKEKWGQHKDAEDRLQAEQALRVNKYILIKGIVTKIVPSQEWLDEEKELGTVLPENEKDLQLEYLYDEILVSIRNIGEALAKPLMLGLEGAVSDLEVSAIEDTFRGDLESGPDKEESKETDSNSK